MAKSLPLSGNRAELVKMLKRYYLENAVLVKKITFDKKGNWKIHEVPRMHKESLWEFVNNNEPIKNYRVSKALCDYTERHFLPSLSGTRNNTLDSVEFLSRADPAFMHLVEKKKFLRLEGCGMETWKLFLKMKKLL